MLDFNTKRKILKKLSDTAERNFLLLLPCLIASGFVRLYYFIMCNLDIALSDENGNFLGIKRRKKNMEPKKRRDDIVYVKRSFGTRLVSLAVSFAFVMMFIPTVMPVMESFAFASPIPASWTSLTSDPSLTTFVLIDGVIRDVDIPVDNFPAPKITRISNVSSSSCTIYWNKDNYVADAGGDALPVQLRPTERRSDGVIDRIEVWAIVTSSNGETRFEKCTTRKANNWKDTALADAGEFRNLPSAVEVTDLDPNSSYQFVLVAFQRWNGYRYSARNFVEAYPIDADKNVTDRTAAIKTNVPRKAMPYYNSDGTANPDNLIVREVTDGETYYMGQYNTTQTSDRLSVISKGEVNSDATTYIPHCSDPYPPVAIGKRVLDDVKAGVLYTHNDTTNTDEVQISIMNDPPVYIGASGTPTQTQGYLVYRAELTNSNANDRGYKLIAQVDNASAAAGSVIYTDTTRSSPRLKPTSKYRYYVVPVTWDGGNTNPPTSVTEYDDSVKDRFITGTIPVSGNVNSISTALTAEVYTKTASPVNAAISQDGVKLVLTWDAVENATGYNVYKRYKGVTDSSFVDGGMKTVTTNSFTDSNVAFDTDYEYEITAVNDDNPNPAYVESKSVTLTARLKMDKLYAPYSIQAIPGDDYVNISWICDDEKAAGFDVQYIRTDRLSQITKNVENQSIAELKAMYPADASLASLTGSELMKYINDNYSADYNDIYNEKFDAQFDANAQSIDVLRDKALVSGTNDRFALTVRNLTNGADYSFRVRSYILSYNPANPNEPLKQPASEYQPYPKGYNVNISTPFNPPQNIKAVAGNGNITVTWDPVEMATGYEIEIIRYDSSKKYLGSTVQAVSGTSYELTDMRAGDIYLFRVRATKRVSGLQDPIKSSYSAQTGAVVGNPITKVTDLTAVQNGDAVDVTWTAATGDFTGYYLYITNNGRTTRRDITKNSYKHTDITYGQTYSYYVVPYRTVVLSDGQVQYFEGDRSNTETITVGGSVGFPVNLTATSGDRKIDLKWDAVAGAEGYVIYASHNGRTESFNVTGTSFTHQNLTPGDTYSYYVVAYKTVNNIPVYSIPSVTVSAVVGGAVERPVDFAVTTNENSALLSWSAVRGASGYTVYGTSDSGSKLEIDVSRNSYTHMNLTEGETWTYYVRAYKLDNNQKIYSSQTNSITVRIGASFSAPTDLVATPGNRTVALKWTASKGVDGYIVYVYDSGTGDFQPLSIVSKPTYEHTGLKNGTKYTYMVAAYRFVNGARVVGDYSLAVSAIPTSGNAADVDYTIAVKGTAPYGITHSELISAAANHDAFNEPVDAYFSVNDESSRAVKEVLRGYADGLKSFVVYPFDISLYLENTLIEVEPNDGYNITFTVPVPDVMSSYRDYITVIHLKDDGTQDIEDTVSDNIFINSTDLEVLPSAIVDVNGIWCVQFTTASCSPFAFVVYKDNLDDVSSGSGAGGGMGGYSGSFNTGILLFTTIPDMLPVQKKTKFVERLKKRYRIKK